MRYKPTEKSIRQVVETNKINEELNFSIFPGEELGELPVSLCTEIFHSTIVNRKFISDSELQNSNFTIKCMMNSALRELLRAGYIEEVEQS